LNFRHEFTKGTRHTQTKGEVKYKGVKCTEKQRRTCQTAKILATKEQAKSRRWNVGEEAVEQLQSTLECIFQANKNRNNSKNEANNKPFSFYFLG